MFTNKLDKPKLNQRSQALIAEIAEKIKATSEKNLFFAVRFNENYRKDYLAIRDELPALVDDDGNYYAIRIIDKDVSNYLRYWQENDNKTPTIKKRSICVYLTLNEDEINELQKAISGKNEFFTVGELIRKTNEI